jgi:hypothetical protein
MKDSNYYTAKYYGPTNTKGARIKIQPFANYWAKPETIAYCYRTGNVYEQVLEHLKGQGITPANTMIHKNVHFFLID